MAKRNFVTKTNEQQFSKFLAYILRHHPEELRLTINEFGWINVQELINAVNKNEKENWEICFGALQQIVDTDNKKRYSFNEDKTMIRANQGHSIKGLIMDYKEVEQPPKKLYHGTSVVNADKIICSGEIKPMGRQMVHLSGNIETAFRVGERHGHPQILVIDTTKLINLGHKIYISENGVYLVDRVPMSCVTKYL